MDKEDVVYIYTICIYMVYMWCICVWYIYIYMVYIERVYIWCMYIHTHTQTQRGTTQPVKRMKCGHFDVWSNKQGSGILAGVGMSHLSPAFHNHPESMWWGRVQALVCDPGTHASFLHPACPRPLEFMLSLWLSFAVDPVAPSGYKSPNSPLL